MHTTATEALQKALATYAGVHTDATFAEYCGYLSILGLVQGLQGAGPSDTRLPDHVALPHHRLTRLRGCGAATSPSTGASGHRVPTECIWMTKLSGSLSISSRVRIRCAARSSRARASDRGPASRLPGPVLCPWPHEAMLRDCQIFRPTGWSSGRWEVGRAPSRPSPPIRRSNWSVVRLVTGEGRS